MATPPAPSSNLFIENLMTRLQLRPPYLDTNSYLSHTLDDFLLPSDPSSPVDSDADQSGSLAKEEANLEREIVRIILSGDPLAALKPNSGQSVDVGGHSVCVGFHEEPGSGYRVWEWHGHIMFFDDESGYSAEYVYGNHFEKIPEENKKKASKEEEEEEGGDSGLKDLVGESADRAGSRGGRILHRNWLGSGSLSR